MTRDICIEIGKTDGFHYLGVQPPSAVEGIDVDQLELPYASYITSTGKDMLGTERAYFHVGYDSSHEPPKRADVSAVETAQRLARLISESTGRDVEVRTQVHWIGFGKYLFSESEA